MEFNHMFEIEIERNSSQFIQEIPNNLFKKFLTIYSRNSSQFILGVQKDDF